jgi:hypothetical protein
MLDFAQHLVTITDPSMINPSAIDLAGNLHFNIADIHSSIDMDLLAQQFKQPDIAGDVGKKWDIFVKSGQIWAMIIGIAVGYLFRSITNA